MAIIQDFAAIVWLFFSWLGELAQLPMSQVIRGYSGTVGNPFNDMTWNVIIPDIISDNIAEFVFDVLNVPTDMTVLGAFLLIVSIVFVVSILVGLITQILP